MDLSNPKADAFYENIKRVNRLSNSVPKEENIDTEPSEEDEKEEDE